MAYSVLSVLDAVRKFIIKLVDKVLIPFIWLPIALIYTVMMLIAMLTVTKAYEILRKIGYSIYVRFWCRRKKKE